MAKTIDRPIATAWRTFDEVEPWRPLSNAGLRRKANAKRVWVRANRRVNRSLCRDNP